MLCCMYWNVRPEIFPYSSADMQTCHRMMKYGAKHIFVGNFLKIWIMKGMLSYIWVNMGCVNCVVSHTSAVNDNVNIYRNLPDNLNYMSDSCHHIDQFICSSCMICHTAAISWSLDGWWDAPDNLVCRKSNVFIFNPSMMFLDVDCYSMVYCVHCPLSLMFSHPVFWKRFISVIRCKEGKFPFIPS